MMDVDKTAATYIDSSQKDQKEKDTIAVSLNDSNVAGDSTKKAPQILAINPKIVHKICSGQVIVTLSTAVKELVENSIDAGATNIDIRLTEHGSKIIEVCDNGAGVEESNLEGLTLKHHTSKISDFEDLTTIETFGFRGEALSSLCSLAKLSVVTKSGKDDGVAYRVDYDSRGKIIRKVSCAREKGTTVTLQDLFAPLPVRHREFNKNLKREFYKMVNVLYGYCLISNGIRINCTNQVGKEVSKVVSIPGLPTMKERIVTLFGPKQTSSLLEIKQCASVPEDILEEFGLSEKSFCSTKYTLEGFISAPNKGRSSTDRQFFWINSRPCEPTKVSRLVNEVYHIYSRNQNPFVCLHIQTKQEEVDVNVTPDKRVIYLQNEKILCVTLKATLLSLFTSASSNFNDPGQQMVALSNNLLGPIDEEFTASPLIPSSVTSFGKHTVHQLKKQSKRENKTPPARITNSNIKSFLGGFAKTAIPLKSSYGKSNFSTAQHSSTKGSSEDSLDSSNRDTYDDVNSIHFPIYPNKMSKDQSIEVQRFNIVAEDKESFSDGRTSDHSEKEISDEYDDSPFFAENCNSQKENEDISTAEAERDSGMVLNSMEMEMEDSEEEVPQSPVVMYDEDFDDDFNPSQISVSLKINWDKIKLNSNSTEGVDKKDFHRKFKAKISPNENASAEEELRKQITKEMFCEMKIIGQFNLGFIVVKCGADMFIVDQHASDEKYNFETLERSTVLIGQTLIRPMDLQLPAISENIIIENLDIFNKNGFDFEIDAEGSPTTRIKMTKIPCSKSVQFGKTDVEELIFMMEDCPEKSFCRPSKVRDMLASRACRKSVMIGTAMNHQEMRSLINHMGLINQPWNCPHGRPTIRHLLNLNILPDIDLNVFNH